MHSLFRKSIVPLLVVPVCWSAAPASRAAGTDDPPNILFIVIDDLGTDRLGLTSDYAPGSEFAPPPTPHIDQLAFDGVLFTNAYASPVCSPARALLMTGRYGYRTGIGSGIGLDEEATNGLNPAEVILPMVLAEHGYSTGVFGKWHLGRACTLATLGDDRGVERFDGTKSSVGQHNPDTHYCNWPRIVNPPGIWDCPKEFSQKHATASAVEEALTWISAKEALQQSWFCVVSFLAVHRPIQWPDDCTSPSGRWLEPFNAMLQHTDEHIGYLLSGIEEETTMVFFMADNGTQAGDVGSDNQLVFPPYDPSHCKGTVYEHGVRVPLIVRGPLVEGTNRTSPALVSLVDVFRTVTDLVGIDVLPSGVATDSISFADVIEGGNGTRDRIFCESFAPNNPDVFSDLVLERSLRNGSYKLIRRGSGPSAMNEFYKVRTDEYEQYDLLQIGMTPTDAANYQLLTAELDAIPLPQ